MHNFFRRLSFRSKSPQAESSAKKRSTCLKKNSSGLLRFIRSDHQKEEEPLFDMPINIMLMIIDQLPFYEQLRLSRLCRDVKEHLRRKFAGVRKLELRKRDIDEACTDKKFQRHFKAYVAVKIEGDTVSIVIDEAWVVGDLYVFLGILEVFREGVETVEMDAPIAELIVISMSHISLERWYAFQCILKAFNDMYQDLHLDSPFIPDRDCFWPKCSDISIHATKAQAAHLGRILDYGVKSGYVFDRRTMDHLKLEFEDLEGFSDKAINKQIYYFRMVDRVLGWLKRRSENSQVTYSRFGLPGDEVDERPPPTHIYVAHFDDDSPEYRTFFTHATRAAAISAGFGLSCSLFSFVMFLFEFRWDDHGRGFDIGTVVAALIFLVVGLLIHWQILIGIKRENPVHMVPAIMTYTFLIVVELIIYVLAANHLIATSSMFANDKQTPTFLTLSVFYLTVVGIQTAMLLSITKARNYYEAKAIHRTEVQVAENGKRLNPGMAIVYVKKDDNIPMNGDPEFQNRPGTSPPPRVILAANDNIA
uniref:F-box domain-containing protein n=1 Tax=Caenorhabditis japonica TaxID=281687 RepID=A0A8R1DH55_CAEJA